MGATALRCQVVLEFFYLLPVLLQLHLKLLYQATEITKHRQITCIFIFVKSMEIKADV